MGVLGEIQISIREYAKKIGVDEAAVRAAIVDGKIKKGVVSHYRIVKGKKKLVKKILASIATKEWGFIHETPRPQRGLSKAKVADKLAKKQSEKKDDIHGESNDSEEKDYSYSQLIKETLITPQLTYQEAVRRKEILAIAKEKMELEEMQGILIKKADVDKALFTVGVEFKKALFNIPPRVINDIRAASTDVEASNILITELQMTLTHIPAELLLRKAG